MLVHMRPESYWRKFPEIDDKSIGKKVDARAKQQKMDFTHPL